MPGPFSASHSLREASHPILMKQGSSISHGLYAMGHHLSCNKRPFFLDNRSQYGRTGRLVLRHATRDPPRAPELSLLLRAHMRTRQHARTQAPKHACTLACTHARMHTHTLAHSWRWCGVPCSATGTNTLCDFNVPNRLCRIYMGSVVLLQWIVAWVCSMMYFRT